MTAALQLVGFEAPTLEGFSVNFAWSWSDRAWGWCGEFAELGFAALALGPLHLQFEWNI